MTGKIEVVSYDSHWKDLFASESKRIKKLLGRNCLAIHHIGSTAVEELWSRPTVDILVVVNDAAKLDALFHDGYAVYDIDSVQLNKEGIYHLFICTEDQSDKIRSALALVEYLKGNEKRREEYSQLKTYLTQAYPDDPVGYQEGKTYYVAQLEQEALNSVPEQKEEADEEPRSVPRSLGMAIGLLMGLFVFHNIGVGLCLGLTAAFLISKLKEN